MTAPPAPPPLDLPADRKATLLGQAEELASRLAEGEVSRSELRPVVNVLFLSPLPWPERLAQARAVVRMLPGSWVTRRSRSAPRQYATVREWIGPLLEGQPDQRELRFLLGWTERKLQMRGRPRRP